MKHPPLYYFMLFFGLAWGIAFYKTIFWLFRVDRDRRRWARGEPVIKSLPFQFNRQTIFWIVLQVALTGAFWLFWKTQIDPETADTSLIFGVAFSYLITRLLLWSYQLLIRLRRSFP